MGRQELFKARIQGCLLPSFSNAFPLCLLSFSPVGSPNFANRTASHAQAEAYYQTYVKWACEQRRRIEGEEEKGGGAETFYYAYFDGRAPSTAPDYEAHFGLVTEDGNKPKFELEDGFCPGEKELLQEKDDKTF